MILLSISTAALTLFHADQLNVSHSIEVCVTLSDWRRKGENKFLHLSFYRGIFQQRELFKTISTNHWYFLRGS